MEQNIETIIINHIGNQNSFINPAGKNLFDKCVKEIEENVKKKIVHIVKSVKAGGREETDTINSIAGIVKDIIVKAINNSEL